MNLNAPQALHVAQGLERSYWGPGDRYTFLVTGEESCGSMFAMDCMVGLGGGPPPHRHLAEDELFYVMEGTVSFTTGHAPLPVSAGESVFVPRGTRHSYVNAGQSEARMLTIYTPAGMEGWFREVCPPVEDFAADPPPVTPEFLRRMHEAGPRYNVEWLD